MMENCPVCDARLWGNEETCRGCGTLVGTAHGQLPRMLRRLVWARRVVLVNTLVCPALVLASATPQPVPIGPGLITLLGLTVILAGQLARYTQAQRLGVWQAAFGVGFGVLTWGLRGAYALDIVLVLVAISGALPLGLASLWTWKDHPARELPWQCERCGYLLQGLSSNRCPECGTPFKPAPGMGSYEHPVRT